MSEESLAPLWDHVEALRKTLLQIFWTISGAILLSLIFYKELFQLINMPLAGVKLALFSPTEGIISVFKCCCWTGVVASSPLWLFFLLRFLAPALRSRERKLAAPFFALSLLFFCGGVTFAYGVTLPFAVHYLQLFNADIGIDLWSLSNYLDFTLLLLLANGLAFEAVVILLFLVHFGVVTSDSLRRRRREAIVAILILSALLTPPDVLTQLLLAIPLSLLYEAAIWYGRFRAAQAKIAVFNK